MARTRELVEKALATAQTKLQEYATAKGLSRDEKKTMRHDPNWRRLQSVVEKMKNQIVFIDKRNTKGVSAEKKA